MDKAYGKKKLKKLPIFEKLGIVSVTENAEKKIWTLLLNNKYFYENFQFKLLCYTYISIWINNLFDFSFGYGYAFILLGINSK